MPCLRNCLPILGKLVWFISSLCQVWQAQVSSRDSSTACPHDAGLSNLDGILIVIQDVYIGIRIRLTNGECSTRPVQVRSVEDADLCRATDVPELDIWRPLLSQGQWAGLSSDRDRLDVGKIFDSGHVLEYDRGGCDDCVDFS